MEQLATSKETTGIPVVKMNKNAVYLLALGIFGIITTEFGVIGVLPQLAEHFKVSISTAGWLITAFALTIAIFGPFITLAASGVNRKTALSLVLLIFIVSNIASMYAPNFTMLLIARILPAFFHPIFFSVAMATAAQSVKPSEAPKAVSIVFSGVSIGTVLGVPVSVYFADMFNWQAAFVVCAVLNLLALMSLLKMLPSMPVQEKASFDHQLAILKKGKVWWNILVVTVFMAGISVSYGYLAEYLKAVIKMDGKTISIMMFLFGLAGVFGNILMGRMLTKSIAGSTWKFFVGIIGIQAVVYLISSFYIPVSIAIIVWGFIMTTAYLLGQTLISHSATEAPEFASSLFVSAGNMGFAIGPLIGGMVLEQVGAATLPLASIMVIAVAVLAFLLQQRIYRRKSAR